MLLFLLEYQSCNYVRMYSKRKNCKERQVAHPSFTPVWNLWKPFTYRYCSSEENTFRDFTLKKLNDGFYQHNFHSCLASAFISPYSWCWRDLRVQCLELCTACMLDHSHHWDKAFHFPGKFHFLVKIITDSVRLGVVYLNLVLSTANEALLCEVCLQPTAHIFTTIQDLFILLSSFSKNRSSIPDPRSPVNLED